MSMVANLLRVTQTELDQYLMDSSLLENRIYNEESDTAERGLTDIDKAWDGILFLLTGKNVASTEHPLAKVFFSGQLIDEEQDLGYGPAHYVTPAQVVALHQQLANITIANLKAKFDPEKMIQLEVYPNIWDEGENAYSYLQDYFIEVKNTYSKAAENGEAIITFIN